VAAPAIPPLVDIVLPTYGPVPYLEEALACVFAQTYANWRLTLVDNSPETGGARVVLAPHEGDPRVHYLATGGLNQAENWTAAFASGDAPYVAMLHDDDLWDPEFVARRVEGLEAHPGCAFAFSAYREIDESGALIALHAPRARPGVLAPEEFVPQEYVRNAVAVQTVMYRRSAYEAVGGRFRAGTGYIDYDLWLRLAVRFPVLSLHVQDCALRSHGESVTAAFARSKRNGDIWLEFVDAADATVDAADATLVPRPVRNRRRAAALVSIAGDDLEAGEATSARRRIREAVRLYPRVALDPRVPVLVALLLAGERSRRAVAALRDLKARWSIPVHAHDLKRRLDDLALAVRRRGY
jgi:glycosyltransferase involved in cell wall biosynthesis